MSFDPFGDFETTGYLRNSLGLKDPAEVKENEHFSFEMGLDEALSYLERTKNLTTRPFCRYTGCCSRNSTLGRA